MVSEQRYIANELYESLKFVIENLLKVYSTDFTYPKIDLLADKILNGHYRKIAIIVSEKEDKNRVYMFWKSKLDANGYIADIDIIYPNEFVNKESFESDVAILTGWFSKKQCREYFLVTILITTWFYCMNMKTDGKMLM